MTGRWFAGTVATIPTTREGSDMERQYTQEQKEVVTHYFFRAWQKYAEGQDMKAHDSYPSKWMEYGFLFSHSNSLLYQACGLAGLPWPWDYKLPPQ